MRDDVGKGVGTAAPPRKSSRRSSCGDGRSAQTLLGLVDPSGSIPTSFTRAKHQVPRCTAIGSSRRRWPNIPGPMASSPHADPDRARAIIRCGQGTQTSASRHRADAPSLRWPPWRRRKEGDGCEGAVRALGPEAGAWDEGRGMDLANVVTESIGNVVPGFANSVLHCSVLTPHDIEMRYGLTEGAVTHGEITLDQVMFMRPVAGSARYAMPIEGLYLGGAGAHPGPGILAELMARGEQVLKT